MKNPTMGNINPTPMSNGSELVARINEISIVASIMDASKTLLFSESSVNFKGYKIFTSILNMNETEFAVSNYSIIP